QRPVVDAGTNQIVPSLSNIQLVGTVSDDGLPYHVTNFYWSVVAPPNALVNFLTPSNQLSTTVSFLDRGTYVMRLTADDGQATNYAEVEITLASTNLTLTPKYGWPTKTNTTNTVVAKVVNQNNAALAGATVSFYINNNYQADVVSDSSGIAQFSYTGTTAD